MQREKIYGMHSVKALLEHTPHDVQQLLVIDGKGAARLQPIIDMAQTRKVPVRFGTRQELDREVRGNHQGVIAFVAVKKAPQQIDLDALLDQLDHDPFLLILDGVTDPHNLGACLRSANAAGVDAVIVPRDNAVGLTPVVRKVACGAAEITPLIEVTNLARTIDQLKAENIWVYGLSDAATSDVYHADLRGRIALVMGAEGKGMRRLTAEKCDGMLRIPMAGSVSSLNVSVAAGVCLFEAVRQRSG